MTLEDLSIPRQNAMLHLFGQPPVACQVIEVADRSLTVCLQIPAAGQQAFKLSDLSLDDLTEIHILNATGQIEDLKIRATVAEITDRAAVLSYIKPKDASIRQLINWLSRS